METVMYEQQIVETVRRLPPDKQRRALELVEELEREEPAPTPKLPRFMELMIEEGTLKLSEYEDSGLDEKHRHPAPSLEELRRRLKGVSVPIEEYIRAERSKR